MIIHINLLSGLFKVFFFLCIFISSVCSDLVDPFDMRNYDPVTKTMKRRHSLPNLLSSDTPQHCINKCQNSVSEYCDSKSNSFLEDSSEAVVLKSQKSTIISVQSRKEYLLRLHLSRLINLLLEKADLKTLSGGSRKTSFLSFELDGSQVEMFEKFSETGEISLLRDISGIIDSQLNFFEPSTCNDKKNNILAPILNVASFFSRSHFLILGIVCVAAIFFYSIYVQRDYGFAFVLLLSVIFFSGFLWTYWKLYEKKIAENLRISRSESTCLPKEETFLWFFTYYVSNLHSDECKEYYYATTSDPLSELTPTYVFYETVKVFWNGLFKDFAEILISMIFKLSENSSWYIRFFVLPSVLTFACLIVIFFTAIIFNKRFKVSNYLLGSVEIGGRITIVDDFSRSKYDERSEPRKLTETPKMLPIGSQENGSVKSLTDMFNSAMKISMEELLYENKANKDASEQWKAAGLRISDDTQNEPENELESDLFQPCQSRMSPETVSEQIVEEHWEETCITSPGKCGTLSVEELPPIPAAKSSHSRDERYFQRISFTLSPDNKIINYVEVSENDTEVIFNEPEPCLESLSKQKSTNSKNKVKYFDKCNEEIYKLIKHRSSSLQLSPSCSISSLESYETCPNS